MTVTADTITDEQIREVLRASRRINPAMATTASIALGELRPAVRCRGAKREARAKCAAAYNARHAGKEER